MMGKAHRNIPKPWWKGDVLGHWVDETGLTDEAFAAEIGWERKAIVRARAGTHASIELLAAVARRCGKPLVDILTPEAAKKYGILALSG